MYLSSTKNCRRDSSAAWSHILRLICLVADRFHDKQDSSLVAAAFFPAYRGLAQGLPGRYRSRFCNGTTHSRTTRGGEKWAHSIPQRRYACRAESQRQTPKRTLVVSASDRLSHRGSEITSGQCRVD